jgi:hypothetical protein
MDADPPALAGTEKQDNCRELCPLAPEYQALGAETLLPMMAFEFGIEMRLHGPADAEIGNQRPALRHLKHPA